VVGRAFPGMGFRPVWLTAVSAWCLLAYSYRSRPSEMPGAFAAGVEAWLGIDDVIFAQHLWSHGTAVVLLLLLPLLAGWVFEGWTPVDLGFRLRGTGREMLIVFLLWLAMLPLVWAVHDTASFARTYPRLPGAATDPTLFLLYEGFYLFKWIAWEFIFRGFMIFGFGKDFLSRSVLIATIPFVIMHFGKPELEAFGSLPAGLILGYLALRSRSIWPGVLLHWGVAGSMDFFASTWWHPS
jgi:membrane protease YdiL (CAAX protease family)